MEIRRLTYSNTAFTFASEVLSRMRSLISRQIFISNKELIFNNCFNMVNIKGTLITVLAGV